MERRMLLAVALSFLAVTAWSLIAPKPPAPEPTDNPAATTDGGNDAGQADAGQADPPGPAPAPTPTPATGPHSHDKVSATTATLENTHLRVQFTSLGAGISSVQLLSAIEPDVGKPFDLIVPLADDLLLGQTDTTHLRPGAAPGGAGRTEAAPGPMRRLHWRRNPSAEKSEREIAYEFTTGDGIQVRKIWSLEGDDDWTLNLRFEAKAKEGEGPGTLQMGLLASSGMLREAFKGAFGNPNSVVLMRQRDTEARTETEYAHGLPYEDIPLDGVPNHLRMLVARTTYFMSGVFADTLNGKPAPISAAWATGEDASRRPAYEHRLVEWFKTERNRDAAADPELARRIQEGVEGLLHAWVVVNVPVAPADGQGLAPTQPIRMFLGPVDRPVLEQDTHDAIEPVISYPSAPDPVARVLLWIYDFWRRLFSSEGLGVILMTLTVRGGLMPLSIRNQLTMRRYSRKVAKVKPKLTQIQKKYASNPKKLREEQMKLYKENGIGFPSGCLMMLIQIPIFFALFSALRVEYSLWGKPFLWIKDLAGPDQLIPFGHTIFNLGFFRLDAINILPILMVIISIFHQRSMPKPADEQQAQQMRMMKWMPIFFAFILYNYTAALALYMVFSAAIGLLESKIVRAKDDADVAADQAEDAAAAPTKA